jgi:hypothetical protein
MENNSRINQSFKNLASFSEEVLVVCPHCNKQALISTKLGKYTVPYPMWGFHSIFSCNHCFKPVADNSWFGTMIISPVDANCGYCGSTLKNESRLVNKFQSKMKIFCKVCKQERIYQAKYVKTYANDKQATDPYFGMQLWLQTSVDDNILWAYNFEHLTYIKEYVEAKLREAVAGGKYSLAWKLPKFIKAAKNRQKILKAIKRLEKKVSHI